MQKRRTNKFVADHAIMQKKHTTIDNADDVCPIQKWWTTCAPSSAGSL